jgi:NADH:ubiquinone oxidoreductase subunit E
MTQQRQPLVVEVCMGSSCFARGNRDLAGQLQTYVDSNGWTDRVTIKGALCRNMCTSGPNISANSVRICHTTPAKARRELAKLIKALDTE